MIGYSALGNRGLLWVAAGVVVGLATQRYRAIVLVPAVVWITLGLNYGIKRIVRRERPLERRGRAPLITAPATPSFPSSHAAMAAAGAFALSVYGHNIRKILAHIRALIIAILAVVMAASRVYLAVHLVFDVVVGLAVGACTGAAFALVAA